MRPFDVDQALVGFIELVHIEELVKSARNDLARL